MKLLLDQGVPLTAAALLRQAGIDTLHTAEIQMATAKDAEILQRAAVQGRILVTLDADFHSLLALSGAAKPSVIRIRIEGLRAEPLSRIILQLLRAHQEDLLSGTAISVRENNVRIRRLPIR